MPASKSADRAARTHWRHRPERSSRAILRLMTWLSLTLGRRASRLILYPIAAYFVLFAPAARRASKAYLARALGRRARLPDGFRHVLSFASVVHDRVYWLRDRFELFEVGITGEEQVLALRRRQRGIIFLGAHFGSFEALRVLGERHGLDVRMLMYPDNARMVTDALAAINPAVHHAVISLGSSDSILQVRDHLARGGCVGILADRLLKEDSGRALDVDFLGAPARFPTGPYRLAALLGAPLVFMAGAYLGGNRYHLHFSPLADFGGLAAAEREAACEQALRGFVAQLESQCRQAPWNWFNFHEFWDVEDHKSHPAP